MTPAFQFSSGIFINTMRSVSWPLLATIWFGLGPGRAAAQNPAPLELTDGDRVVMVGDTLIEREQAYGYIEFQLTTHFPDRQVTFRNLGWSADTPQGQSRVGFDH